MKTALLMNWFVMNFVNEFEVLGMNLACLVLKGKENNHCNFSVLFSFLKNKKKEKIDASYVKSLARLIGGEKKKKKRFEKREFLSDDDYVLKEQYELLRSRRRYKRLKVQLVAVNHRWTIL